MSELKKKLKKLKKKINIKIKKSAHPVVIARTACSSSFREACASVSIGTMADAEVPSLTKKQLELIISTWDKVKENKEELGGKMFCK